MSEKLKTVVKLRAAARSWVTRCGTKLGKLCDSSSINITELTDAVEEFDQRIRNLDEAQATVEFELEESDIEEDIVKAADFRNNVRQIRIQAAKILTDLTCIKEDSNSNHSVAASSANTVEAKLPKLELPTFSGDVTTWMPFWEQFQVVIDDTELPDVSKFSYLQSLLKGEAKAAIQGLSLTGANYKAACDILKQRFGRKECIIFSHIQELLSVQFPRQTKVPALWKIFDCLQSHIRSLEALGISGEQYGVVLTPLVLSRLPAELRTEWVRDCSQHEGDLQHLMTFLQKEIERREKSQTFETHYGRSEKGDCSSCAEETVAPVGTCSALHSSAATKQTCALCNRQGHTLEHCYSVTKAPVENRKEILKKAGVCFRCLSTTKGHVFRRCQAKCIKCKGKHHVLLCVPKQSSLSAPNSANTCVTNEHKSATNSSVGTVHLSSVNTVSEKPNQVLLQTAKVSVLGQSGAAEVIVLFDTGSDKSYVSSRLVEKVGPEWVGSHDLAYAAFGSSRSFWLLSD